MNALARFFLATTLLASGAATAAAQENAAAKTLASNYQLADAVGERKCAITLEAKSAPGGFALTFEREVCGFIFSYLADVAAWRPAPAGGINFVSAKGAVVAEFTEGVGGVYEAIRENDGVYFLANLKIADIKETQIADLTGEWSLSRPGGPSICKITLTNETTGENRLAIRVAPGCDGAIVSFGLASWQLASGDLLLFSVNGDLIRLGKNEEGVWSRVPDQKQSRPPPLQMKR